MRRPFAWTGRGAPIGDLPQAGLSHAANFCARAEPGAFGVPDPVRFGGRGNRTLPAMVRVAPVKRKDDKTRYPRVGVLFENHNRETGEVFYTIRLDFPIGVTELVAFPPKPRDDDEVTE